MTKPLVIHPAARLKDMPPMDWLIEDFIPKGALVTLFGASGLGKSFLALDMCLSVSSGEPWLGRYEVEQGHTVYLPFEGVAGMGQRMRAWEAHRSITETPSSFWYTTEFDTLQHSDPMTRFMLGLAETLPDPPKLVIVDTLSKAMMGSEENSARDANLAMSQIDRLRAATGCAVVLIHHTTKNTDSERGSTAIRAACDTMLLLKRDDDALLLSVDKQRDSDPSEPVVFYLSPIEDSVVPTLTPVRGADILSPQTKLVIDAFWAIRQGDAPVPYAAWRDECEERGVPSRSFSRRLKDLVSSAQFVRMGDARPTYKPGEETPVE